MVLQEVTAHFRRTFLWLQLAQSSRTRRTESIVLENIDPVKFNSCDSARDLRRIEWYHISMVFELSFRHFGRRAVLEELFFPCKGTGLKTESMKTRSILSTFAL